MTTKKKAVTGAIVLALLVAGILIFWRTDPKPVPAPKPVPVTPHKASCWAKPGVIGYEAPGKYIPVYTTSAGRHGPGPNGVNVCGGK